MMLYRNIIQKDTKDIYRPHETNKWYKKKFTRRTLKMEKRAFESHMNQHTAKHTYNPMIKHMKEIENNQKTKCLNL